MIMGFHPWVNESEIKAFDGGSAGGWRLRDGAWKGFGLLDMGVRWPQVIPSAWRPQTAGVEGVVGAESRQLSPRQMSRCLHLHLTPTLYRVRIDMHCRHSLP